MSYAENLWLFFVLLAGIIILPGMDMMFVITNAITGGRRAGFAATGGMMAGGAVHTLSGAVGISLLAATLPAALTVMLFAGAAYMAWIGVDLIGSAIIVDRVTGASPQPVAVIFRQALMTCLLNPKAYLFISATYPQFLRPEFGNIPLQALILGVMTVLTQLAVYGTLALAASGSGAFLRQNRKVTIGIGRGAGVIFIAVAAMTLWHASMAIWRA